MTDRAIGDGPTHYRAAENLLENVQDIAVGDVQIAQYVVQAAQAHATLALVAAVAETQHGLAQSLVAHQAYVPPSPTEPKGSYEPGPWRKLLR